jgi:hypothetical protein
MIWMQLLKHLIQFNTALLHKNTDAIITRNTKDFKNNNIPVITSEEALSIIEKTKMI